MRACAELKLRTNPNIDYINDVILNQYMSYSAMRALECFITQKISSEGKKGGIFPVIDPPWKTSSKHIGSGTYGSVSISTIFEKSLVVVKTIKKNYNNMAHIEYSFCTDIINNLRYYCPNFSYTLGAFSNSKGENICFEYAGKDGIVDFFNKGKHTIDSFFPILIQVLSALEIGQRECRFCHYDLSWSNIIIRDKKTSYKVNIGSKTIEFDDVFCPVIIDFGMSTGKTSDGKTHSVMETVFYNGDYGKYYFLLPGFDMFFILADMYCYISDPKIKGFLKDVLSRYYGKKPYDFSVITSRGNDDQWGKISKSNHIAYTPGSLLDKIITDYPQYRSKHIRTKERDTFEINSLNTLSDIFNNISRSSLDYVKKCLDSCDSYIMYTYYTDKEPQSKYIMLERDRQLLLKARNVKVNPKAAVSCGDFLRDATLRKGVNVSSFLDSISFIDDLITYANIYYMIKEMKLDIPFYNEFVAFFETSGLYRYFTEHSDVILYARRWAMTLIEYSQI